MPDLSGLYDLDAAQPGSGGKGKKGDPMSTNAQNFPRQFPIPVDPRFPARTPAARAAKSAGRGRPSRCARASSADSQGRLERYLPELPHPERRTPAGPRPHQSAGEGGRVSLHRRALRLRQVDAAALDRGPAPANLRSGPDRRQTGAGTGHRPHPDFSGTRTVSLAHRRARTSSSA